MKKEHLPCFIIDAINHGGPPMFLQQYTRPVERVTRECDKTTFIHCERKLANSNVFKGISRSFQANIICKEKESI